ncbi:hypothetical protein ERJ75_000216300 [Trypanosoma vivax]|uniref:Uncharacterized protein n=1 Tax=Trypanosoma vivax (strain Y486) TaxID=1055687 RepID=G0U9T0_TRYVY|nr:hypothetical protein ERJ75_000216300 [Trypanosoma vivax]CCC52561.1 conserved hypothetical protein [Trypanosoma vivax Y486]
MGLDYVVLSPTELIICREEAKPLIEKILNLLLRGGALGYLELERSLYRGSVEDFNISTDKRRVNPVSAKAIMSNCGVLLTSDEYKVLCTAYSDAAGFLVDEFLSPVCPLGHLTESDRRMLEAMVEECNNDQGLIPLEQLVSALEVGLTDNDPQGAPETPFIASTLMELQTAFSEVRYPNGMVPTRDVMNFFASVLLNAVDADDVLIGRIAKVKLSPLRAPEKESTSAFPTGLTVAARQERGFDYYLECDRKDEWLRGRKEAPAGPMYKRFLPGYTGHLPTFRSKFGRSFHPIEESLPQLTQPKRQLEPMPTDRYGPGVELKVNRMNRHSFKLA